MKIINSKTAKLMDYVTSQLRKALKNFIGEEKVEIKIKEIFKVISEKPLCFHDVKIIKDNVVCNFYPPYPPSWINVNYNIVLKDIPNTKSLSQALYEYFEDNFDERWDPNFSLMKLECQSCGWVYVYNTLSDIPVTLTDEGTLDCPNCKAPWLTYSYEKEK